MIWLHGISDAVIALACLSIAALLVYFRRRLEAANRDLASEIAQRRKAEAALESAYREMEEKPELPAERLTSDGKAMLNSGAQFRATFEQAAIGLAHVSTAGRLLQVNGHFCEIVGYTREELVGMSFDEVTHPEDLEADWAQARQLLAGTIRQYQMEKRYIHKDGRTVWAELTGSLVSSANLPDYFIAAVEDITPRKLAEARLLESERKFKELANAMPHVVWTADADGTFDFFNDRWTEVLGEPEYGRRTEGRRAFMEEEDYQRWMGMWQESLQTGLPHEMEYRLLDRRVNEYRWYLGRAVPVKDRQGLTTRWVGTCTDIHRQKLTEQALKESERSLKKREQQLSALFNEGSIGDFTWDISTDELSAHPTLWKMYGIACPERTGPVSWLRERRHPEDAPAIGAAVEAALKGEAPLELNFRIVRDDGSIRWIACRGVVIHDERGAPVQAHGFNIDITELKNAETEIQKREQLFRELANAMPQIVWTARPDGSFDYYNDRWYELSGLERAEDGDSGRRSIMHAEDLPLWIGIWDSSRRSALPYEIQCRLWDQRTREFRWHLQRGIPVKNNEGAVTRWVGTCTDIHEQKTAEGSLEGEVRNRTKDLEKSLLEKETLLKEVHHRVKNNLQVISSLLNMQANALSDATAVSALKDSQRRVLLMAMVHERLYGNQRMDAIDFGEYTEALVEELAHSFGHSGVVWKLETMPVLLNIDQAVPCGLILSELVTNALKYAYRGQAGGEITVALAENDSRMVTVVVKDKGAGLPEGLDWRSAKSLGLAIVQTLTKQIGGTVSVSSGPGTTFSVAFQRVVKENDTSPRREHATA